VRITLRVGGIVATCLGLLIVSGGAPAFAQATTAGGTITVMSTESITSDVAYDPAHNMYLVVAGRGPHMLRGSFVSPSGAVLSTFEIGEQWQGIDPYFEAPRISYCPDYAAFLVAWTDGDPATPSNLWARGVAANADGSPNFMTPQFRVETGIVKPQQPALAYSPASREFLVAYTMDRTYELRVRRISLITGISHPISIATPAEYPSVAFNPAANEFLVAYRYEPDPFEDIQAVRVKAGTGAVLGAPVSVNGMVANVLLSQPDVQYDPAASRYFVTWWHQAGGELTFGRFLNADTSDAGVHLLAQGAGSYDCLANARSPVDGTYFVTMCSSHSNEVFGVRVNADGSVSQPLFQVTSSGAAFGSFGNRVAANGAQPGWMVTASVDQRWIAAQLISVQSPPQSVASAGGAPGSTSPQGRNRPSSTSRSGYAILRGPMFSASIGQPPQ
jgi:hypothetical protein